MNHLLTPRHAATTIPLKSARLPAWLAGVMLVIVLMAVAAGSATWLVLRAVPALQEAELRAAEDAAFSAGRVTAYAELSEAMAQVYEDGRQEGLKQQGAQR